MECVIGLYKTECVHTTVFHDGPYKTLADVEYATAGWVEWYNNRRLHSAIQMHSPIAFENAYYANLTPRGTARLTSGGKPEPFQLDYCSRHRR